MKSANTDRTITESDLEKIVQSLRHYSPGAYGAMREGEGKYIHINELLEAVADNSRLNG